MGNIVENVLGYMLIVTLLFMVCVLAPQFVTGAVLSVMFIAVAEWFTNRTNKIN